MRLRCILVACAWIVLAANSAHAQKYEYIVEGTLKYFHGPDTSLDGAIVDFRGTIDADAVPFFLVPEVAASYEGNAPATVRIAGSQMSDGLFSDIFDDPISVGLREKGSGADLLQVWHNGAFALFGAGGPEFTFSFSFLDPSGKVFDDLSVPGPGITEADFMEDNTIGFMAFSTPDHAFEGSYLVNVTSFRIIPEPATASLLLLGAVALLARRRRS